MTLSLSPVGRPRKPERRVVKISAENAGWLDWMGLVMNKPIGEVADLALEMARESLSTLDEKENKA